MLAIVAILMTVMMASAALAIDVGSFDQAQRQAQSAADAAALAAARGLPGTASNVTSIVESYVAANDPNVPQTLLSSPSCMTSTTFIAGICIVSPYNSNSSQVQVRLFATSPSSFGNFLGVTKANVSATSVAGETATSTPCGTPGNTCYAIFANDSTCSHYGVNFGTGTYPNGAGGGGTTITGGVHSNSSINVGGGGSHFGPTTYGNGSGCLVSPSSYQQNNNSFTAGPTAIAPISWPIDYSTTFPDCGGTGQLGCTGPGGTPSFCTQATTATSETLHTYNPSNLSTGNIYCDVGTGTASLPRTWNGTISAAGGFANVTFVAGSVTILGGSSFDACGYSSSGYTASSCSALVPSPTTTNYPLAYAVSGGIDDSAGGSAFHGDLFAPLGTINIGGGTWTTFAEGNDISAPGGGFTGDGPLETGTGSSATDSESLLQ